VRHVQCILCFFCLTLAYAWRVNLSVALVAMTEKPNMTDIGNDSLSDSFNDSLSDNSSMQPIKLEVDVSFTAKRCGNQR